MFKSIKAIAIKFSLLPMSIIHREDLASLSLLLLTKLTRSKIAGYIVRMAGPPHTSG